MTLKIPLPVTIDWMSTDDLPPVLEIERSQFPLPWSRSDFCQALTTSGQVAMVARFHGNPVGFTRDVFVNPDIAGYVVYSVLKFGYEITRIAVRSRFQRRAVASQLIARLARGLNMQRRTHIRITVDECNLNAQLFLKAMGFRCTRIIPPSDMADGCDSTRYYFTLRYRPIEAEDFSRKLEQVEG